jgi:hypothetical protein
MLTTTEYDSQYEPTQQLLRTFDKAQGVWTDTVSGTKWTRYKNASKRDTVVEAQTWDNGSTRWYKSQRTTTHYNARALADTVIEAVWDTAGGVGKWLNTSRTANSYDASDRVVLTTIDGWDKTNQRWTKSRRVAYVYNGQGLLASDTSAVWDTSSGAGKYLYTVLRLYAYNATAKDTTTITKTYSQALDDFLNVTRDTYVYDASGNQTVWTNYRWTKDPQTNGLWLAVRRETNTYNGASKVLTTTWENYDSTGSKWSNASLEEWAYDGNGNPQTETFSSWDTTLTPDAWAFNRKLNWTYIQMDVGVRGQLLSSGMTGHRVAVQVGAQRVVVSGLTNMKARVFDMAGREIVALVAGKGVSAIAWDFAGANGLRVSTGNYLMKVTAPGFSSAYSIGVCR